MFSNGIPQFDLDDPSFFDNNNGGDFNFDGFDFLDSSNVAGPSQTYPGVGVIGDLNSYPEYLIPPAAPKSLYSENELYPNKGKTCRSFRWWSFKDSLFGRRIYLPTPPGHNRALLVTSELPSLPTLFLPLLGLSFTCSNPFPRLYVSPHRPPQSTYSPFVTSSIPLPRTTHRARYPHPPPVPPTPGYHEPRWPGFWFPHHGR